MISQQQIVNIKGLGIIMFVLTAIMLPLFPVCAAPVNPGIAMELTLDQAVSMALANNPTGKIAVFDYEAAKGALTAARSYRWPTVSGNHTDSRSKSARTALDPNPVATDRYSNSVTASWLLYSGHEVESQIRQAKLALDVNSWGVELARQQLIQQSSRLLEAINS